MLKKTITYTNFADETVTEDFYFNLTETEIAELELDRMVIKNGTASGGLLEALQNVTSNGSGREIMDLFRTVIRKSYGIRSTDGRKFYKTEDAWEDFVAEGAYSALFSDVMNKPDEASSFINGIMPAKLRSQVQDHLPAQN